MGHFSKASSSGTVKSALIGAALLGLSAAPLSALAADTKLTVSATVLKHASMQVVAQPGSVVITAEDISRGYVDVPSPSQITVQSNTQAGYMLMFASQGDFIRHTLVRGLSSDLQLSADGGVVAQPAAASGLTRTALNLGYRFVLSPAAQQGVYAWPMRVSVAPL